MLSSSEEVVQRDTKRPVRRSRRSRMIRAGFAGFGAATIGAIAWMILVAAFGLRLGFVAIAIGISVGAVVRHVGKGRSEGFGVIAMLAAVFGCILGDILGGIVIAADGAQVSLMFIVHRMDFNFYRTVFHEMFTLKDGIFYAIALFTSYKYAVVVE